MRKFISKYFPALPVGLILIPMFFTHSCANTKQAPSGGPKDSIPPVLVKVKPEPGVLGVPVHGATFEFTFDEYVKVKNPKNIFLSPPMAKAPKYKMRGKSLIVYFEEDLDSNTTYTLDFTDAIQDNNEGNPYPGFTYAFSTGEHIDSMYITGVVQDCNTLMPVSGATVMLYKDLSDSAIFNSRPSAAVKTDDWGFFSIRNIADTTYRLYAIQDEAGNNIYDSDADLVAFVDSIIRPVNVVNDTVIELKKMIMTDTLLCLSRKAEYELNLFKERGSKQMIKNHGRTNKRSGFISFSAPRAHIDTMWIRGISADRLITQFNARRDSLEIWVNDQRPMPDTLHLFVNYRKTDTTGERVPYTEHVKLFAEGVGNKQQRGQKKEIEHNDTICVVNITTSPETVQESGYKIVFDYPIIKADFDSVRFYALNPKQQEVKTSFRIEKDSTDLRTYHAYPEETLLDGYEYFIKLPERAFRDINGFYNDSTQVKVSLPTDETLSTLVLNLTDVRAKYIIDLQDENRKEVLRTYVTETDKTITIPYLKPANYCIRITEDLNRNSMVDSGDLLSHQPPEKVKYYKVGDDTKLNLPESAEIVQDINLTDIFKN